MREIPAILVMPEAIVNLSYRSHQPKNPRLFLKISGYSVGEDIGRMVHPRKIAFNMLKNLKIKRF
jgi:hypothetical protein